MTESGQARVSVATTRDQLGALLQEWDSKRTGSARRVVVMTMGALHAGHLRLVARARELAGPGGQVIATIFVNPLQFGAGEDLDRYPRDLAGDVEKLATAGVDLVFAPAPDLMYPEDPVVRVSAGRLGQVLEGAVRPGHFDGVLTVVLKLINLTRPDVAVFGEKDAQQLVAVRRMVRDLNVPVEVASVPIVRDDDRMALSSRNRYLSARERVSARALSRALGAGRQAADRGAGPAEVLAAARGILDGEAGVIVDYLTIADPDTLEPFAPQGVGSALLLVAARVGTTRLIDNVGVTITGGES